MLDRLCGLHKRIMKHDIKAIDEIQSLEEAKEIIKMIAGGMYSHGTVYLFDSLGGLGVNDNEQSKAD